MKKKLIVGITIPGSVGLLEGQLSFFKDLGYETYLMSPRGERSENYCELEGCQLLEVKMERDISPLKDLRSLFSVIKTLKKVKPDIVNFGTPKMGLLGMLGARICGVKRRIYTCRGFRYEHEKGIKRWLLKKMEWLTGACAHRIICISPSVKVMGINDGMFEESKCFVINMGSSNGINLEKFDPKKVSKQDQGVLMENLGLKNFFVYGFLGRLIDRKGISELYHAFCRVYEKDTNTRLLVVGLFDFAQIADKSITDKIKNHEGIIWPGRTDEVPLFISVMDVFILPAWWEGFGNVLVQAAAMGIPVIGTNGTGTCDAVSHGFNGLLVEPKDVDQLEKAMLDLKADTEKREMMGKNGIEWARHFDSKIIWEGIHKLYLGE
jgi:glycosyltransferase involved in cell wall biosynthesis